MASTWFWYENALLKAVTGAIDFDADTFKVMLTTSAYTPNQATHVFRSDVTNEVAASGTYASGGGSLGSASVSLDTATSEVRILWSDIAFTGATITARTAVIYKSRGGAASADELVGYATEPSDVSSTTGTYTVDFPTTAVLKITAA